MSDQAKSVARLLGNSYAQIQHKMDLLIEWGFTKMREQGDLRDAPSHTPAGTVESATRGIVGFFGAMGDAYYRRYEELKREKK